jgi:hypothetical protein
MNFVKTDGNNTIVTYPYKMADLITDNPKVSFPCCITEELAASWNVFPVVEGEKPVYAERIQNCVKEAQPTLDGDIWTIGWTVTDKTADETTEYDTSKATENRSTRDELLKDTDWWATSDRTMTQAQTDYRQALRDITTHANWPDLSESDWPVKP